MSNKNRRIAFTLAEVLITLGIIGVVAAMTIPTLVANYQKKATATKVKKAYAEFAQAIRLSEADNGPMNFWNFGDSQDGSNLPTPESARLAIEKYIVPYYKNIKECSEGLDDYTCGIPVSNSGINYILGSGIGLSVNSSYLDKAINVIFTVNNIGSENAKEGRDWFFFTAHEGKVMPAGWYQGIDRDEILEGGIVSDILGGSSQVLYSCKESEEENDEASDITEYSRRACTALLMLDNWEFKDDYPF